MLHRRLDRRLHLLDLHLPNHLHLWHLHLLDLHLLDLHLLHRCQPNLIWLKN
jgi:hypothetical protein